MTSPAALSLFGATVAAVFSYHQVCVSCLYLSSSAIMDSPGGKFNSYNSKDSSKLYKNSIAS